MREQAFEKCERLGQQQLLRFEDQLNVEERNELYQQIMETDFSVIQNSIKGSATRGVITPIDCMTINEIDSKKELYSERGLKAIRENKVAAVLLAGGMGTRLGSDGPKGIYSIGETKELTIFQCLIHNLMEVVSLAGNPIHLFVMTSDKNHDVTVQYFEEHQYLGYPKDYIHFFKQEMAPATDYNGKIYLEEKNRLATSPNGNGGWYSSLVHSGLKKVIDDCDIQWLNVFSVDNVLQRIADPVFVGATIETGKSSGSKVIRKNAPDEKVGVMCLEDGKPSIVEYYELTDELMNAKTKKGEPAYQFGVILNYLFRVDVLENILKMDLPLHVVEKKIPYVDAEGVFIQPTKENGHKFETLILDMIHLCPDTLVYEIVREREFAPVKNRTGVDSVDSARDLLKKNGISL